MTDGVAGDGAGPPAFTLEPQTAQHAAAMFALLSDDALYTYLDQPPPASEDALRERFARLEARRSPDGSQQWLNWVIRLHGSVLAGYVQATVHPDHCANVAYVLGTAFAGRGIARAATARMLQLLAREHGVQWAFATADRRNARSLRLLRALGFSETDAISLPHRPIPQVGDVLLALALPQ